MEKINGCPVVHKFETFTLAYGEYHNVYMIWAGYFGDGSPAFQVVQSNGEVITNVNVSLVASGRIPPEGHIFVPDYSEHAGKVTALELAGVAEIVDYIQIGYGDGCLMKLKIELPDMPSPEEVGVPKR